MDPLSFELEPENCISRKRKIFPPRNIGQTKNMPKNGKNEQTKETTVFVGEEEEASSQKGEPTAKRQKQFAKCAVCAQDSLYHYYGVQSCEGCKQFFRRTIVKQKMFICWKSRQCDVAKGDRCRGCRMDKCLLMGMDPSLVNVNRTPELERFIERLEQTRLKLLTKHYAELSKMKKSTTTNSSVSVPVGPSPSQQCSSNKPISMVQFTERPAQQLEKQKTPPQNSNAEMANNHGLLPPINFTSAEFRQQNSNLSPANESANFSSMSMQSAQSATFHSPELYVQPFYSNEQMADFQLIQPLTFFGQSFKQIWESGNEIPGELMNREIFEYLKDPINILYEPSKYSFKYCKFWDRAKFIEGIETDGFLFKENMDVITKDRYLCMEMAKTLPFFCQMDPVDQAHILRQALMPMMMFFNAFYSANINAQTWTRSNGHTMKTLFETKKFRDDQRIAILSKQMLSETVDAFRQVQLAPDEFIILVAILLATTTSTEISSAAREFLYAESVRYSKALFRLMQTKYGLMHSQKYATLMNMLNMGHKYNYTYQTMVTYLDIFVHQKDSRDQFPKALAVLMH